MKRTVLVHLNVEVPEEDTRSADVIADEVIRNLNGGQTPAGDKTARPIGGTLRGMAICSPLAEEV